MRARMRSGFSSPIVLTEGWTRDSVLSTLAQPAITPQTRAITSLKGFRIIAPSPPIHLELLDPSVRAPCHLLPGPLPPAAAGALCAWSCPAPAPPAGRTRRRYRRRASCALSRSDLPASARRESAPPLRGLNAGIDCRGTD